MLRFLLLLIGCYALAYGLIPKAGHLSLIDDFPITWRLTGGAAAIAVGLLLSLRRRGGSGEITDRPIKDELIRRGFHFIAIDRGWQAEGVWNKIPVIVRRTSDFHASRFGRPWVL